MKEVFKLKEDVERFLFTDVWRLFNVKDRWFSAVLLFKATLPGLELLL